MKVSLLTSGFTDEFTDDFINCVKEYYHNNSSFVLVASDFTEHSKTDRYLDVFLSMFGNSGIVFNKVHIIDDRITREKALQYIGKADIVWIAGGDTLKQIAYLKEYNLIPALQNREGITIGMSAGSINMAKRVVLAKDIDDNVPKLSIYDGIGLVDINIEPHLDSASEDHMKDIYEASQYSAIYGICDNTFIKITNDTMDIYGTYFKYENISE
ncbi:Type 1 glutamine amidotransferase-like domain-containing protein [Clostridium sp. Marseille-QA1073]